MPAQGLWRHGKNQSRTAGLPGVDVRTVFHQGAEVKVTLACCRPFTVDNAEAATGVPARRKWGERGALKHKRPLPQQAGAKTACYT